MPDPEERKLRLWYRQDGRRIPLEIFTDAQLNIKWIQLGDQTVDLKQFVENNASLAVLANDADVAGFAPLFSDVPCWFPECEELRAAYNTEIASEQERARAEGRNCLPCDLGDIRRKYIALMRRAKYPAHPSANVSFSQSSGPADANEFRATETPRLG